MHYSRSAPQTAGMKPAARRRHAVAISTRTGTGSGGFAATAL